MTLAEKLKNARAAKHLSQRALAEATGLSLRTIQNYELGARLPKQRETYALLARALDVEERVMQPDLQRSGFLLLPFGKVSGRRRRREKRYAESVREDKEETDADESAYDCLQHFSVPPASGGTIPEHFHVISGAFR